MPPPSDEAKLVGRAQQGDRAAMAEIYDRHHSAIYRYIFYRVGDAPTAEDLTGTVFVRVVENIDGFVYRGRPILSWLYTIARNVVVDFHRRGAGQATLPLDESLMTGPTDVEEAAEQYLTQARLAAAMTELTEEQRQVIILRFIEGMTCEEVSRVLDKRTGAVKSLQHRGLAALARILKPVAS